MDELDKGAEIIQKGNTLNNIGDDVTDTYLILKLNDEYSNYQNLTEFEERLKAIADIEFVSPILYSVTPNEILSITKEIIVKPKKGMLPPELDKIFEQYGIERNKAMEGGNGVFILTLKDKNDFDTIEVANKLFETSDFTYSTPSFFRLIKVNYTPNDPYFPDQTNLNGLASGINIINAWDLVKGDQIRIAIMDVAILTTHEDLSGNIVSGYDATGQPIGYDIHGTQTAGVASAVTDNSIGVAGVSFNSSIIPVRVGYTPSPGTTSFITNDTWVISCFNQCESILAADVINCSFTLGNPSSSVTDAINSAAMNGRNGKGCVICVSSGNGYASSIDYPASLSSVIAVGATDPNGYRANFSNYGAGLDIAAPGTNIITTDRYVGYTDLAPVSGTSYSSPTVAGASALVLKIAPQFEGATVRQILCRNAAETGGYSYPNGISEELGWGRLNVNPAIKDAIKTAYQIDGAGYLCNGQQSTYSIHNLPSGMTVTWSASNGLVINSSTGAATAQLPTGTDSALGVITVEINNGLMVVSATRKIPIGPYQGEVFGNGRVAISPEVDSWAPAYGYLLLKNNEVNAGTNFINFGYAPSINKTTQDPPVDGEIWPPYGVDDVQVLAMPSGWIYAGVSGNTLSIQCNDASGTLEVNLHTPCGWCFARFLIQGFN